MHYMAYMVAEHGSKIKYAVVFYGQGSHGTTMHYMAYMVAEHGVYGPKSNCLVLFS
jgi:hypothetical protein